MTEQGVADSRLDAVLAVKAALAGDDDAVGLLIDQNNDAGRLPGFLGALVGLTAAALTMCGDAERLLAELAARCIDDPGQPPVD